MKPDWMCPECGHAINHHAPYSRVVGCMEEYDAICGCRRIWRDAEEQLAALLEAVSPLLAAAEKATPGPWTIYDADDIWATTAEEALRYRVASLDLVGEKGERQDDPDYDFPETDANAAFIVAARNTADALRDLLGPTGGEA